MHKSAHVCMCMSVYISTYKDTDQKPTAVVLDNGTMYLSFPYFPFFMVSCFGTVFSTECSCAARGSLKKNQLSAHSRQAPEILQWNEVGIYQSPHTQLPGGWTGPGQGGVGSTHLASHAGSLACCPQPGDTPFLRTGHCRCHLGLPWTFLSRQLGEA